MPALGQFLANLLAADAFLTRSARIDSHEPHASFLGFALQHVQEAAPGDIADCPRQPAVPDHPLDVQAFDSDQAIGQDQLQGDLVVMLAAKVADASVNFLETTDSLPAIASALLLTADGPADPAQVGQRVLEIPRVRDVFAVASGKEGFQPDVDADGWLALVRDRRVRQFAGEYSVPLAGFTLERHRLNLALDRTVQFHADQSDMLHAKTVAVEESDAVAVSREGETVEPVAPLESRIAGLLAVVDAAEEVFKRPLQAPHRGLCGGEVEASEEGAGEPLRLEPRGLFGVLHRPLFRLISRLPLFKALVVQASVRFEHDAQFAFLVGVRPKPVLECAPHLLPLLAGDVLPDGCLTDVANGTSVVASGPQTRQAGAERLELRPHLPGCVSFETVDDLRDAQGRVGLDEQVNVVGPNLNRVNSNVELRRLLDQQVPQPGGDFINKDWPAVLWAPHEVVLQTAHRVCIFPVSPFHTGIIQAADN